MTLEEIINLPERKKTSGMHNYGVYISIDDLSEWQNSAAGIDTNMESRNPF